MSSITFDTHQLIRELREADFTEKQAETVVRIIARSQEGLVTREHFDLKTEVLRAELNGKFTLLQWMIGILLAGVMSLILKAFF
jgi:hypothetical protein